MNIQSVILNGNARLTAYIPDAAVGYQIFRRRPGIVLAPGGAYLMHATREKEGVAIEFLSKGYNVFLLEYSVGFSSREVKESGVTSMDTKNRFPLPLLQLFKAIHIIKQKAEAWNTDADRLFLLGFSAGGHLCGSAGVFWNKREYWEQLSFTPTKEELKTTGMILCYPMLNASPKRTLDINRQGSMDATLLKEFLYQTQTPTQEQMDALNLTKHISKDTIPTFIWHSIDDPVVDAADSSRFILALQEMGIDCEYHLFDYGGHGLALANEVYARNDSENQPEIAEWTSLADKWMKRLS